MKKIISAITTFLLLFFVFAVNVNAQTDNEHFIFIISNNKLVKNTNNIVVDENFIIFHNYNKVYVHYWKGNTTYMDKKTYEKVILLEMHDNANLIVKDISSNATLINTIVHKNDLFNALKYNVGMQFHNEIISIVMAFIGAMLVNIAYYYNLERRII